MKRRSVSLPLVLLISMASAVTPALATSAPTPWGSNPNWPNNQILGFAWKAGKEPPSWMKTAVKEAASDSTASRDSKAARIAYDAAAVSWVAYTDNLDYPAIGQVAYKSVPGEEFHMKMRVQGYVFDWGTLKWCQYYDSAPSGCIDAETIALHELGHVQGLAHVEEGGQVDVWTDSIMHKTMRSKGSTGWNMHAFGRCDVARLQMRYGPLDSYTPISTCLSVDTALTHSSSASYVDYGTNVTFTAYLRIANDAEGKELGGNPLSGRSVVLQYRPIGGSSWTTFGQLSASSGGKYTATVAVRSDREWRARFGEPSGEGLNASSSAVVTVRVVNVCGCVTESGARV
jgi:hypothetical protein